MKERGRGEMIRVTHSEGKIRVKHSGMRLDRFHVDRLHVVYLNTFTGHCYIQLYSHT